MLRHCFALFAGLVLAGPLQAATWGESQFTDLHKDFGSVPRGPTLTHTFHLVNRNNATLHIARVRASCSCVRLTPVVTQLKPGEETDIIAQMDTNRFQGQKVVHIFVQFDQPHYEEVRLWVQANSRNDVMITPDTMALGQVRRASCPTGKVNITFLGGVQGRITGVRSDSNYIVTTLQETKRDSHETDFRLTAQLRVDTPVGRWFTDIWVLTDNPSTPRIRVPLTVEIEPALSVSPGILDLGQLKVGAQAEQKIIVRGTQPFRITEVKGSGPFLTVRDTTVDSKPVHVLAVTLKASKAGDLKQSLRIMTDLKEDREVGFQARAQIAP